MPPESHDGDRAAGDVDGRALPQARGDDVAGDHGQAVSHGRIDRDDHVRGVVTTAGEEPPERSAPVPPALLDRMPHRQDTVLKRDVDALPTDLVNLDPSWTLGADDAQLALREPHIQLSDVVFKVSRCGLSMNQVPIPCLRTGWLIVVRDSAHDAVAIHL